MWPGSLHLTADTLDMSRLGSWKQRVSYSSRDHSFRLNSAPPASTCINLFGTKVVSSGRHEWAVICRTLGARPVAVGVANICNRGPKKFSLEDYGIAYNTHGVMEMSGRRGRGCARLFTGDVLFIRIDLDEGSVTFCRNGIDDGNFFSIPHAPYRLGIALFDVDTHLQILSPQHAWRALLRSARGVSQASQTAPSDRFLPTNHHSSVQIDEEAIVATNLRHEPDTVYGTIFVTRGIFEWILYVRAVPARMSVGIWGHDASLPQLGQQVTARVDSYFRQPKQPRQDPSFGVPNHQMDAEFAHENPNAAAFNLSPYSFPTEFESNNDSYLIKATGWMSGNRRFGRHMGFSEYDYIRVLLNMDSGVVTFYRNGNEVEAQNVRVARNFGYRLAVTLYKPQSQIEIISGRDLTASILAEQRRADEQRRQQEQAMNQGDARRGSIEAPKDREIRDSTRRERERERDRDRTRDRERHRDDEKTRESRDSSPQPDSSPAPQLQRRGSKGGMNFENDIPEEKEEAEANGEPSYLAVGDDGRKKHQRRASHVILAEKPAKIADARDRFILAMDTYGAALDHDPIEKYETSRMRIPTMMYRKQQLEDSLSSMRAFHTKLCDHFEDTFLKINEKFESFLHWTSNDVIYFLTNQKAKHARLQTRNDDTQLDRIAIQIKERKWTGKHLLKVATNPDLLHEILIRDPRAKADIQQSCQALVSGNFQHEGVSDPQEV